jgi:two-component system response regulator MprA
METPNILVVDDNPAIRDMVSWALELDGYEVSEAAEGGEALQIINLRHPDLMLVDHAMPGMDGAELVRRLRDVGDNVYIIMISAGFSGTLSGALQLGMDDLVIKPFDMRDILIMVRARLQRKREPFKLNDMQVLRFADLELQMQAHTAFRGSRELCLTAKQYRLLHFFMSNPKQVLKRDIIQDHVWGFDFEGESNIVDVYVGYVRRILEEGGEPRLIQTVRGVGYILKEASAGR